MAFLASLKKDISKFKEKEEEKEAVYVPFAEFANVSDNKPNENTDDKKQDDESNNVNDTENKQENDENNDKKRIRSVSIACISDIHLRLKELTMVPADILVLSGDYTNKGSLEEAKIVNEWLGEMKKQFGYKHIVAISGNHEGYGDILINDDLLAIENGETICIGDENKEKQYEEQELIRIKTQKYLHEKVMTNVTEYLYDESITIEGIKFYGSPWSANLLDPQDRGNKKHFDRGFHGDVPSMKRIWDKIPLDVEYLIIHGPPQGILDINGKGCSMLRLKISELKQLRVCQFGHVHSGFGWSFITKKSIQESIKHIDKTQKFERTDFNKLENIKYSDDLPFPVKLDMDTRRGKTLKQYKKKGKFKKAVKAQNINIMNDVALFVNAATDGIEQPIHFKLPIYCNK